MGNLREAYAISLYCNLDSGPYERPVDRVGAGGKAHPLGTSLWHLAFGQQQDSANTVLRLLYKSTGAPPNSPHWTRLCEMAIIEYVVRNCHHCKGAGEIVTGERKIVCTGCKGSKVHRYSDRARALYMGLEIDVWKRWEKKFNQLLDRLAGKDRNVNVTMLRELERLFSVK